MFTISVLVNPQLMNIPQTWVLEAADVVFIGAAVWQFPGLMDRQLASDITWTCC